MVGCCRKFCCCCFELTWVTCKVIGWLIILGFAAAGLVSLPFLITAAVLFLLLLYFAVRFIEFATGGDGSYTENGFSQFGDKLASLIFSSSLFSLVVGWEIWLPSASVLKLLGLRPHGRHHLILELEAEKWIKLLFTLSVVSSVIMFPRFILFAVRYDKDINKDVLRFTDELVGALECAFFIAVEAGVVKYVPIWKHHVVSQMGTFQTWKLIQLFALILLGITLVNVLSRIIVFTVEGFWGGRKHAVYYTKGLRISVNRVIISTLVFLLVWAKHVAPQFKPCRRLELVTWTLVCLSIASGLWVVKKWIVLTWTAHAVYDRFNTKIIEAAKQFHCLVEIGHAAASDSAQVRGNNRSSSVFGVSVFKLGRRMSITRSKHKVTIVDNSQTLAELQQHTTTVPTHKLQQFTLKFRNMEDKLKEGDTTIATKFAAHFNQSEISTPEVLLSGIKEIYDKSRLTRQVAEILFNQIKEIDETEVVDVHKFEKWEIH